MNKETILHKYAPVTDNMLLILHDLQNSNPHHYLSEEDLDTVANYLNTTRGVVYGIVQYYTMFCLTPRGKHIIRICISPVCGLMGGLDILHELKTVLGIELGETTEDGLFTLEHSECLGQCDKAPVLMMDEEVHGNLTADSIKALIAWKKLEHHINLTETTEQTELGAQ